MKFENLNLKNIGALMGISKKVARNSKQISVA